MSATTDIDAPTRFSLLVNPSAGRGQGERRARVVLERLGDVGAHVLLARADSPDAMRRLARREVEAACRSIREGVGHAVVAVGGDGTVHVVLQEVAEADVPFGVVPAGSGDDAARAWGLPRSDPRLAADRLVAGTARRLDLGLARAGEGSRRWFATVLAAGFDARVSERALRLERLPASVRYLVALGAELRSFAPLHYRLTLDGETSTLDGMLVSVAVTSHFGGGMMLCPDADPTDGLFDVFVLDPLSTPQFLAVFPRVYRGTHLGHPAVHVRTARTVRIAGADVVAFADGERLGPLPQSLEVRPGAVSVLGAAPARRIGAQGG